MEFKNAIKNTESVKCAKLRSSNNSFAYYYDGDIAPGEIHIITMPQRTPNRRGVNDIGFAYEEGIELYATLSQNYKSKNTVWQKIEPFDEINKTVCHIAAFNNSDSNGHVNINIVMF